MDLFWKKTLTLAFVGFTTLISANTNYSGNSNTVPYGQVYNGLSCGNNAHASVNPGRSGSAACMCIVGDSPGYTQCGVCYYGPNIVRKAECVDLDPGNFTVKLLSNPTCGCQCTSDSYADYDFEGDNAACRLKSRCADPAGTLSDPDQYGYRTCTCSSGYQFVEDDDNGGCVMAPSARARRRSRKSQMVPELGTDAFYCPDSETACSLGSGYECIDTTSSLDSCGGCLDAGGVNCMTIPGSLGVACIDSKCIVSSCFPGWSLVDGECIKN